MTERNGVGRSGPGAAVSFFVEQLDESRTHLEYHIEDDHHREHQREERKAHAKDRRRVFGKAQRPDFDVGVLCQLPCRDVSFERDVTAELWSEKEKLMYGATPLYMLRAVKTAGEERP